MRRLIKSVILLLLTITTATITKAQNFGGNPPEIKWKQVNTPAARVIFPAGMDSTGQRVASIIAQMYSRIQPTIGQKQRQVSIVLQNQTTQSNGYVGLAPFRSEFYLTPDQNTFELGSLPFADQLAVHEFRHVQQFNNFNVGLAHVLKVIFGEGGQSFANEISVPNWFFEGDAVFNETYVTNQGRGRLPYFYNGYRALWVAGKNYSYMKLRNGSYKDFVPDHYPLGYMLVSYGREKYGENFWKNVTHRAASLTAFYPMQSAVKKYSGLKFADFQYQAFDHYFQEFNSNKLADYAPGPLDIRIRYPKDSTPHKHFVANFEYPAFVNDSTIIYSKTSYDKPGMFVINTNGVEHKIKTRNFGIDSYLDYSNGTIIYASYRPNLRWGYRDYSEITLLNVKTGHETRVTESSKYFSPSLSADGKRIVAVQVLPNGSNQLHVLGLDGKLITALPNKDNLFYTYPKFYGDKIISAVRKPDGTMSIALTEVANGNTEYLLAFSIKPIGFPSVHGDKVYFSATEGMNDGLFALSLTDKKLYRLNNETIAGDIGNYQPTASANKLAWVSFSAYGYEVHQTDNSKIQWQPLDGNAIPGSLPDMGITALNKGNAVDLLTSVNNTNPPVTNYNKAFHLLNFHTLQPDFESPNYRVTLQGNNVLNTMLTELSYNYNSNEGYSEYSLGLVYGAWFPYLSAGVDFINNRLAGYDSKGGVYYNQLQYHGGFQLPFTLSKGTVAAGLSVGSDVVYSRNFYNSPYDIPAFTRELVYLNNYINFTSHGRSAKKNIFPAWGLNLNFNYKNGVNALDGDQLLTSATAYLPGLFANHSLVITGAYHQHDKQNKSNFSNDFTFARGYTAANLYQISKVTADYHFPIAYPDLGLINAAYLSRIRANIFYDYSYGYDPYNYRAYDPATAKYVTTVIDNNFNTAGAQITFDGKLWNFYDYSIGIRYSHMLNNNIFSSNRNADRIEIVVPISIF